MIKYILAMNLGLLLFSGCAEENTQTDQILKEYEPIVVIDDQIDVENDKLMSELLELPSKDSVKKSNRSLQGNPQEVQEVKGLVKRLAYDDKFESDIHTIAKALIDNNGEVVYLSFSNNYGPINVYRVIETKGLNSNDTGKANVLLYIKNWKTAKKDYKDTVWVLKVYYNYGKFDHIDRYHSSLFTKNYIFATTLDKPVLLTPINNIKISEFNVTFRWTKTAFATNYRLVYCKNSKFSGFVDNGGNSYVTTDECRTMTTSELYLTTSVSKAGQTYYWKVRASKPYSTSEWSNVGVFKTKKLNTNNIGKHVKERVEINEDFNLNDYKGKEPFVIKAKINGANLFLVGTRHTSEFDSSTFKTIKYIMENNDIDYLIVEGINIIYIHKQGFQNFVMSNCSNENSTTCEESYYAIYLANINGDIDYTTGRPSTHKVLNYIITAGYTQDDYISLRYARHITGALNRKGKAYFEQEVRDGIERVRKSIEIELDTNIDFKYNNWKNWYKQNVGRQLTLVELYGLGTSIEPKEKNDPNSNILENLAYTADQVRNPNVKSTIENALQQGYKNILVVYGAGHMFDYYKKFLERSTKSIFLKYY